MTKKDTEKQEKKIGRKIMKLKTVKVYSAISVKLRETE